MSIMPKSKPQRKSVDIKAIINKHGVKDKVVLVGIRGYYKDSMGKPNVNDRGLYDDAIFIITPSAFASFNANVDPSNHKKGIANLKPGVWKYKLGIHGLSKPKSQQYQALVQAAPVTVHRDREGDDTGWFGINIHRGSNTTTSSLGCQTIPPTQWNSFMTILKAELSVYKQQTIPYVLELE